MFVKIIILVLWKYFRNYGNKDKYRFYLKNWKCLGGSKLRLKF